MVARSLMGLTSLGIWIMWMLVQCMGPDAVGLELLCQVLLLCPSMYELQGPLMLTLKLQLSIDRQVCWLATPP